MWSLLDLAANVASVIGFGLTVHLLFVTKRLERRFAALIFAPRWLSKLGGCIRNLERATKDRADERMRIELGKCVSYLEAIGRVGGRIHKEVQAVLGDCNSAIAAKTANDRARRCLNVIPQLVSVKASAEALLAETRWGRQDGR